jgi:hypothetical protein
MTFIWPFEHRMCVETTGCWGMNLRCGNGTKNRRFDPTLLAGQAGRVDDSSPPRSRGCMAAGKAQGEARLSVARNAVEYGQAMSRP